MSILTAEQIARAAEDYSGRENRARINAAYRKQDDSHLWPVCGRFNVTERAIRRIRRLERDGAVIGDGLEYAYTLESIMSEIVNSDC